MIQACIMDVDELADESIKSPDTVKSITAEEVTSLLDYTTIILSEEPVLIEVNKPVVFIGDTHGDYETTRAVVDRYLKEDKIIVFLGDYVDRSPVQWGSVYNIIYLFLLKYRYPDRFILLRGNHEANNIIPCYPYSFDYEVEQYFKSPRVHDEFVKAFSMLPLMVISHRVYAAHGGFIPGFNKGMLTSIDKNDRCFVEMIVWSDPVLSPTLRGAGYRFKEDELRSFLTGVNSRVFIRGHDYHTLGLSIYNNQCLTIFTSRTYKDMGNGGVLAAEVDQNVKSVDDVRVMDYSTGEWRLYKVKKNCRFII